MVRKKIIKAISIFLLTFLPFGVISAKIVGSSITSPIASQQERVTPSSLKNNKPLTTQISGFKYNKRVKKTFELRGEAFSIPPYIADLGTTHVIFDSKRNFNGVIRNLSSDAVFSNGKRIMDVLKLDPKDYPDLKMSITGYTKPIIKQQYPHYYRSVGFFKTKQYFTWYNHKFSVDELQTLANKTRQTFKGVVNKEFSKNQKASLGYFEKVIYRRGAWPSTGNISGIFIPGSLSLTLEYTKLTPSPSKLDIATPSLSPKEFQDLSETTLVKLLRDPKNKLFKFGVATNLNGTFEIKTKSLNKFKDRIEFELRHGLTSSIEGHTLWLKVSVPVQVLNVDNIFTVDFNTGQAWNYSTNSRSFHKKMPFINLMYNSNFFKAVGAYNHRSILLQRLNEIQWLSPLDKQKAIIAINNFDVNQDNFEQLKTLYKSYRKFNIAQLDQPVWKNLIDSKVVNITTQNWLGRFLANNNLEAELLLLDTSNKTLQSKILSFSDLLVDSFKISAPSIWIKKHSNVEWHLAIKLSFKNNLTNQVTPTKVILNQATPTIADLYKIDVEQENRTLFWRYFLQSKPIPIENSVTWRGIKSNRIMNDKFEIIQNGLGNRVAPKNQNTSDYGWVAATYPFDIGSKTIDSNAKLYIQKVNGKWIVPNLKNIPLSSLLSGKVDEKLITYIFNENIHLTVNPYNSLPTWTANDFGKATPTFGIKKVSDVVGNSKKVLEDWEDGRWNHIIDQNGLAKTDGIFGSDVNGVLDSFATFGSGFHKVEIELFSQLNVQTTFQFEIDESNPTYDFAHSKGNVIVKTFEGNPILLSDKPISVSFSDSNLKEVKAQFISSTGDWYDFPLRVKSNYSNGKLIFNAKTILNYQGLVKFILIDWAGNRTLTYAYLKADNDFRGISTIFDKNTLFQPFKDSNNKNYPLFYKNKPVYFYQVGSKSQGRVFFQDQDPTHGSFKISKVNSPLEDASKLYPSKRVKNASVNFLINGITSDLTHAVPSGVVVSPFEYTFNQPITAAEYNSLPSSLKTKAVVSNKMWTGVLPASWAGTLPTGIILTPFEYTFNQPITAAEYNLLSAQLKGFFEPNKKEWTVSGTTSTKPTNLPAGLSYTTSTQTVYVVGGNVGHTKPAIKLPPGLIYQSPPSIWKQQTATFRFEGHSGSMRGTTNYPEFQKAFDSWKKYQNKYYGKISNVKVSKGPYKKWTTCCSGEEGRIATVTFDQEVSFWVVTGTTSTKPTNLPVGANWSKKSQPLYKVSGVTSVPSSFPSTFVVTEKILDYKMKQGINISLAEYNSLPSSLKTKAVVSKKAVSGSTPNQTHTVPSGVVVSPFEYTFNQPITAAEYNSLPSSLKAKAVVSKKMWTGEVNSSVAPSLPNGVFSVAGPNNVLSSIKGNKFGQTVNQNTDPSKLNKFVGDELKPFISKFNKTGQSLNVNNDFYSFTFNGVDGILLHISYQNKLDSNSLVEYYIFLSLKNLSTSPLPFGSSPLQEFNNNDFVVAANLTNEVRVGRAKTLAKEKNTFEKLVEAKKAEANLKQFIQNYDVDSYHQKILLEKKSFVGKIDALQKKQAWMLYLKLQMDLSKLSSRSSQFILKEKQLKTHMNSLGFQNVFKQIDIEIKTHDDKIKIYNKSIQLLNDKLNELSNKIDQTKKAYLIAKQNWKNSLVFTKPTDLTIVKASKVLVDATNEENLWSKTFLYQDPSPVQSGFMGFVSRPFTSSLKDSFKQTFKGARLMDGGLINYSSPLASKGSKMAVRTVYGLRLSSYSKNGTLWTSFGDGMRIKSKEGGFIFSGPMVFNGAELEDYDHLLNKQEMFIEKNPFINPDDLWNLMEKFNNFRSKGIHIPLDPDEIKKTLEKEKSFVGKKIVSSVKSKKAIWIGLGAGAGAAMLIGFAAMLIYKRKTKKIR